MNKTITAPRGFKAAGAHVGIKKSKKDLSIIQCDVPATAAACFTQNLVKAAPVARDMAIIDAKRPVRAVVINSGNANACTGKQGMRDCEAMAATLAELTKCKPDEVLVCSTGVIGQYLPMQCIIPGIASAHELLGDGEQSAQDACLGIMTTDTYQKHAYEEIKIADTTVKIAGMCKGSGMIHPNMATLLSFITTDANISGDMLQKALSCVVRDTYNMISVDRDTSTNDTIIALSSCLAGNAIINGESEEYYKFLSALGRINQSLAKEITRDGEGATKLIEIDLRGAKSDDQARALARSVCSSNLFKAALFGADANCGRVLCAMGNSGEGFDLAKVKIAFTSERGSIDVYVGDPIHFDEEVANAILSEREVKVTINLNEGEYNAKAWGCDLTYDYVRINGSYRS
ncbi:MAG: bifunctional glutamate N-acetyltransferase/amino-acid acetyltransferase ArgJ [Clostridiales bacterium]|nr:bifunctional glutamate N-acetyltransferase/amino-acid acetyltransferase ArgJ [Clostridiales bacterium]